MDFHSMKRKELQALCKKHNLPANKTNLEMAQSLASLLLVETEEKNSREKAGSNGSDIETTRIKKVKFCLEEEKTKIFDSKKGSDSDRIFPKSILKPQLQVPKLINVEKMGDSQNQEEERDVQVRVTRARARKSMGTELSTLDSPLARKKKKARIDVNSSKNVCRIDKEIDEIITLEVENAVPMTRSLRKREIVVCPKRKEVSFSGTRQESNGNLREDGKEEGETVPIIRSLRSRKIDVYCQEEVKRNPRKTRKEGSEDGRKEGQEIGGIGVRMANKSANKRPKKMENRNAIVKRNLRWNGLKEHEILEEETENGSRSGEEAMKSNGNLVQSADKIENVAGDEITDKIGSLVQLEETGRSTSPVEKASASVSNGDDKVKAGGKNKSKLLQAPRRSGRRVGGSKSFAFETETANEARAQVQDENDQALQAEEPKSYDATRQESAVLVTKDETVVLSERKMISKFKDPPRRSQRKINGRESIHLQHKLVEAVDDSSGQKKFGEQLEMIPLEEEISLPEAETLDDTEGTREVSDFKDPQKRSQRKAHQTESFHLNHKLVEIVDDSNQQNKLGKQLETSPLEEETSPEAGSVDDVEGTTCEAVHNLKDASDEVSEEIAGDEDNTRKVHFNYGEVIPEEDKESAMSMVENLRFVIPAQDKEKKQPADNLVEKLVDQDGGEAPTMVLKKSLRLPGTSEVSEGHDTCDTTFLRSQDYIPNNLEDKANTETVGGNLASENDKSLVHFKDDRFLVDEDVIGTVFSCKKGGNIGCDEGKESSSQKFALIEADDHEVLSEKGILNFEEPAKQEVLLEEAGEVVAEVTCSDGNDMTIQQSNSLESTKYREDPVNQLHVGTDPSPVAKQEVEDCGGFSCEGDLVDHEEVDWLSKSADESVFDYLEVCEACGDSNGTCGVVQCDGNVNTRTNDKTIEICQVNSEAKERFGHVLDKYDDQHRVSLQETGNETSVEGGEIIIEDKLKQEKEDTNNSGEELGSESGQETGSVMNRETEPDGTCDISEDTSMICGSAVLVSQVHYTSNEENETNVASIIEECGCEGKLCLAGEEDLGSFQEDVSKAPVDTKNAAKLELGHAISVPGELIIEENRSLEDKTAIEEKSDCKGSKTVADGVENPMISPRNELVESFEHGSIRYKETQKCIEGVQELALEEASEMISDTVTFHGLIPIEQYNPSECEDSDGSATVLNEPGFNHLELPTKDEISCEVSDVLDHDGVEICKNAPVERDIKDPEYTEETNAIYQTMPENNIATSMGMAEKYLEIKVVWEEGKRVEDAMEEHTATVNEKYKHTDNGRLLVREREESSVSKLENQLEVLRKLEESQELILTEHNDLDDEGKNGNNAKSDHESDGLEKEIVSLQETHENSQAGEVTIKDTGYHSPVEMLASPLEFKFSGSARRSPETQSPLISTASILSSSKSQGIVRETATPKMKDFEEAPDATAATQSVNRNFECTDFSEKIQVMEKASDGKDSSEFSEMKGKGHFVEEHVDALELNSESKFTVWTMKDNLVAKTSGVTKETHANMEAIFINFGGDDDGETISMMPENVGIGSTIKDVDSHNNSIFQTKTREGVEEAFDGKAATRSVNTNFESADLAENDQLVEKVGLESSSKLSEMDRTDDAIEEKEGAIEQYSNSKCAEQSMSDKLEAKILGAAKEVEANGEGFSMNFWWDHDDQETSMAPQKDVGHFGTGKTLRDINAQVVDIHKTKTAIMADGSSLFDKNNSSAACTLNNADEPEHMPHMEGHHTFKPIEGSVELRENIMVSPLVASEKRPDDNDDISEAHHQVIADLDEHVVEKNEHPQIAATIGARLDCEVVKAVTIAAEGNANAKESANALMLVPREDSNGKVGTDISVSATSRKLAAEYNQITEYNSNEQVVEGSSVHMDLRSIESAKETSFNANDNLGNNKVLMEVKGSCTITDELRPCGHNDALENLCCDHEDNIPRDSENHIMEQVSCMDINCKYDEPIFGDNHATNDLGCDKENVHDTLQVFPENLGTNELGVTERVPGLNNFEDAVLDDYTYDYLSAERKGEADVKDSLTNEDFSVFSLKHIFTSGTSVHTLLCQDENRKQKLILEDDCKTSTRSRMSSFSPIHIAEEGNGLELEGCNDDSEFPLLLHDQAEHGAMENSPNQESFAVEKAGECEPLQDSAQKKEIKEGNMDEINSTLMKTCISSAFKGRGFRPSMTPTAPKKTFEELKQSMSAFHMKENVMIMKNEQSGHCFTVQSGVKRRALEDLQKSRNRDH